MTISTILFITLALIAALGFSFFQYLYGRKNRWRKDYIFFGLRALVVFLLLLLLINPKINTTTYSIEKSELLLLADNSASITHLNSSEELKALLSRLKNDEALNQRFQINTVSFGKNISLNDSLNFSGEGTDIYNSLAESEKLMQGENNVLVLLSDGNQNEGRDFRYYRSKNDVSVFPLVLGDTTRYKDLKIERINSNQYAFLDNRFPVEIFLNYSGEEAVEAEFRIRAGENIIYTEDISFTKVDNSKIINTTLPATSLGVKTYSAEISVLEDEENKKNNTRNFGVEVIDERTSVLLLTGIIHPDLGALKKSVESNRQRSLDIKNIDDDNLQLSNYQLIILYQVNRRFNDVYSQILKNNQSFFLITGTETDWNYLNQLELGIARNSTNQVQEVFPIYNRNFGTFQFEDIKFNDFPPLEDNFGPVVFNENQFDVMLFQEMQGVNTGEPLLAISKNRPKFGFLLGENIWRWRAKSYLDNKSFEVFDDFLGKIIQNLTSNSRRERLAIDYENFYYENQNILVTAQYFDENYQFDSGADLKINLTHLGTQGVITSDLLLKNNFYVFNAGALKPGSYEFTVEVENSAVSRSGSFEVIEYNTEQQFVSANKTGMQAFADFNNTKVFYPDQLESLKEKLLKSETFKPVQKSHQKTVPLVEWYYLLFILILFLAAEWFYRKYLGLI